MENYIVELESGVYLAPWSGDPGRTLVRDNAMVYSTRRKAMSALFNAQSHRPFKNGRIVKL